MAPRRAGNGGVIGPEPDGCSDGRPDGAVGAAELDPDGSDDCEPMAGD